jgi:hypothetical protein
MSRPVRFLLFLLYALSHATALAQPQPRVRQPRSPQMTTHKKPPRKAAHPPKPIRLPAHELPFRRLSASELWPAPYRDSLVARPGLFWLHPEGLLYRAQPHDTVFVLLDLTPPPSPYDSDLETVLSRFAVFYSDLNHDGSPEVLIGFWKHFQGNGMRGSWVGLNLLDVRDTPRLLLSATTENTVSGWHHDYEGSDPAVQLFSTDGWARAVRLNGLDFRLVLEEEPDWTFVTAVKERKGTPELVISRAYCDCGPTNPSDRRITPLKPGRYQYRGGQLEWVGN